MRRLATLLVVLTVTLLSAVLAEGVMLHATSDDGDALYRIDTADGTYALIGSYALNDPGTESFIGGLAFDEGLDLFYGISSSAFARLYTINPVNAATVDIGPLNVGFVFEGGLAIDPTDDTLYGVNQGSSVTPTLFTVNTSTGAASIVGQIGVLDHDFAGLAFDASGQLYGLDRVTDGLWRIDKSDPDGAGTTIVGSGLGGPIDMGNTGGMAEDANGVVYGYASGSMHLFTVDLSLGTGTVIHSYSSSDPVFYSLGFATTGSAVEPLSWGQIKALYR